MKREIIRKLDKPYFLLRTHDRISHYMQPQMERMFFFAKHGLGAFLPHAKIVDLDGTKAVKYSLTKTQARTLRPLRFITSPELGALRKAAEKFLSPNEKLTKYENDLRHAFKLPDPELEPDAYYLWGTKRNPKLLVLWGVEKVPGSSLPVFSEKGNEAKINSVCGKLAGKVVRRTKEWVGTTVASLLLLMVGAGIFFAKDTSPPEIVSVSATNDPMLINVVFDEDIDLTSLGIESFKLRNTAHELLPQVSGSNSSTVTLELKNPLVGKKDYFLDFGLSQRPKDLAGNQVGEREIDKSERERQFRFEDLQPPYVVELEPLPPSSLIVRVNEPVSIRSVLRPSTFWLSEFTLIDAVLNEENKKEIVLEFEEPLVHNGSYLLEINGLEDDSEYRNQLHEKVEFRYLDTFGPDLIETYPAANQAEVILVFDECLDPESGLQKDNYKVDGSEVLMVSPYKTYEDFTWGKDSFKAVRLVTTPLVTRREYQISVNSVGDRMSPSNVMNKQNLSYMFNGPLDRSPPFISKAKGVGDKLIIEFSEILDHRSLSPESIIVKEMRTNREMKVGAIDAEIITDKTVVEIQLETAQFAGQMYRLSIKACNDSSGNGSHLDHLYKARGIFRKPITLNVANRVSEGESVVGLVLPKGVFWESNAIKDIKAYGLSMEGSNSVDINKVVYEKTDIGGLVKLNLKRPLVAGEKYQFFLEGATLADGSVVDRPYHVSFHVGT